MQCRTEKLYWWWRIWRRKKEDDIDDPGHLQMVLMMTKNLSTASLQIPPFKLWRLLNSAIPPIDWFLHWQNLHFSYFLLFAHSFLICNFCVINWFRHQQIFIFVFWIVFQMFIIYKSIWPVDFFIFIYQYIVLSTITGYLEIIPS